MIYSVDRTKQRSQAEIIRLFGKYRARNLGFWSGMAVALQQPGKKERTRLERQTEKGREKDRRGKREKKGEELRERKKGRNWRWTNTDERGR